MATNISHIRAATTNLLMKIDAAIEAIENKESDSAIDTDRMDAFTTFRDEVEQALDDLNSAFGG